jgi:hypothetical protein
VLENDGTHLNVQTRSIKRHSIAFDLQRYCNIEASNGHAIADGITPNPGVCAVAQCGLFLLGSTAFSEAYYTLRLSG